MRQEHLESCQVETPESVVDLMWRIARSLRPDKPYPTVVDLSAGDGRFASSDYFERYVGIEIDEKRLEQCQKADRRASFQHGDAIMGKHEGFSLAIGNPPYIRHHRLNSVWRAKAIQALSEQDGISLKLTANLFVLFLLRALQSTAQDGVVIQLVPYEWVSRPSAKELRDFIRSKKWNVAVYRFNSDIFPTVLTTASVTIIDKSKSDGIWQFGEILSDGKIRNFENPTGTKRAVLPYENRAEDIYGIRGLSPGGQEIFVLTEEERLFFGLEKNIDVRPAVTTLRHVSPQTANLDKKRFREDYLLAGKRCWLIRTDRNKISANLEAYVQHVGDRHALYSTNSARGAEWWKYKPHPTPALLCASAFVGKASKVLVNEIGAIAVGAVYGIIVPNSIEAEMLAIKLRNTNMAQAVVGHSNDMKKIEVRQLNALLSRLRVQ